MSKKTQKVVAVICVLIMLFVGAASLWAMLA